MAADTATTVGEATAEAEITDSITGERLIAAVDQRAGTKQLNQLSTWDDVKAACEFWAEHITKDLVRLGVRTTR